MSTGKGTKSTSNADFGDDLGFPGDDGGSDFEALDAMPLPGAARPTHPQHRADDFPDTDEESTMPPPSYEVEEPTLQDEIEEQPMQVQGTPNRWAKLIVPGGFGVLALVAAALLYPKFFPSQSADNAAFQSAESSVTAPRQAPFPAAPAQTVPRQDQAIPGQRESAGLPPLGPLTDQPKQPIGGTLNTPPPVAPAAAGASDSANLSKGITELVGVMHELGNQVKSMNDKVDQTASDLNARSDALDKKVGGVDDRVGSVDKKVADLEKRLDDLEAARAAEAKAPKPAKAVGVALRSHGIHRPAIVAAQSSHWPLSDYRLRGVAPKKDVVLVETPDHQFVQVHKGEVLPGVGRVIDYAENNGEWVLQTSAGEVRP